MRSRVFYSLLTTAEYENRKSKHLTEVNAFLLKRMHADISLLLFLDDCIKLLVRDKTEKPILEVQSNNPALETWHKW